ncbi:MAG: hypothetical protein ABSH15_14800 [Verrucomicrobiota bacterium]|jgi:hypothetical protein
MAKIEIESAEHGVNSESRSRVEDLLPVSFLQKIQGRAQCCAENVQHPVWQRALIDLACAASHLELLSRACEISVMHHKSNTSNSSLPDVLDAPCYPAG